MCFDVNAHAAADADVNAHVHADVDADVNADVNADAPTSKIHRTHIKTASNVTLQHD